MSRFLRKWWIMGTTQKERFKYMREEVLNLTQKQLADKLGLNQQNVADIETGRKQKIDTEILFQLTKEYDINTEWLLFGTGDITKLDTYEKFIQEYCSEKVVKIPFYEILEKNTEDIYKDEKNYLSIDERLLKNILGITSNELAFYQTNTNSMDNGIDTSIKKNDLLLIDLSEKNIINDDIYLIDYKNEKQIARLNCNFDGSIVAYFDNSKTKKINIDKELAEFPKFLGFNIIGKVVWNISRKNLI